MKLSQSGIGTMRVNNIDTMYPAQDILLQSGQLVQYGAGIYAYSNIPLLVKRKIETIVQEELNKCGCIEVLLPILQPDTIWKQSGRWDAYIKEGTMLTVESNKGDFCLAPTAEEAVVEFAREKLKSYKHLPATFYQIGEKFRNEIRPRGYLLRGKTFPMMDAYSFNKDEEELISAYKIIREAYINIFKRLELSTIPVVADNGAIGGKKSEEFMVLSDIGEDTILYDKTTRVALNEEVLEKDNYKEYLKNEYKIEDISNLQKVRAIELGHIFQLGKRYSEVMNATYIDKEGKEKPFYMGCYGIGISRTVATIYEKSVIKDNNGNVNGFALPVSVAPYLLQIIPKMDNEVKIKEANELYEELMEKGINAILDDRDSGTIGSKIRDCKVLGTPFMAVLGDKIENGMIELENIKTGEKRTIRKEDIIGEMETIILNR